MRAITYAITDRASLEAMVRILKAKHPTLYQLKIPCEPWLKIYRGRGGPGPIYIDGVNIYCNGEGGRDYR